MTPCDRADVYWRLRETCCLFLSVWASHWYAIRIQAGGFSDTSVRSYQNKRLHIPEQSTNLTRIIILCLKQMLRKFLLSVEVLRGLNGNLIVLNKGLTASFKCYCPFIENNFTAVNKRSNNSSYYKFTFISMTFRWWTENSNIVMKWKNVNQEVKQWLNKQVTNEGT